MDKTYEQLVKEQSEVYECIYSIIDMGWKEYIKNKTIYTLQMVAKFYDVKKLTELHIEFYEKIGKPIKRYNTIIKDQQMVSYLMKYKSDYSKIRIMGDYMLISPEIHEDKRRKYPPEKARVVNTKEHPRTILYCLDNMQSTSNELHTERWDNAKYYEQIANRAEKYLKLQGIYETI